MKRQYLNASLSAYHSSPVTLPFHSVKVRFVAYAVSLRHFKADVWVQFKDQSCGMCSGQSSTGAGLSPSTSVFFFKPFGSFHHCSIPIHLSPMA